MPLHQQVFEAAPDAFLVVDSKGALRKVNRRACEMFGYEHDVLLQLAIEDLLPERFRARHIGYRVGYFRQPTARPMGENLELWARRSDGSELPVDVMLSPLSEAEGNWVLCVVRDLSRQHDAERRFKVLLEASPDALIVTDREGRIVHVNDQAVRLFGYARSELFHQFVELLLPPPIRSRHVELREEYARAPSFRPMGAGLELRALHRRGHEIPVEVSLSPLRTGEGLLVSAVVRDLRERKQAQRVLADLREKEALLKEIHHRVKNNLSVVSSMLYLQSTHTRDEEAARVLRENQDRVKCMAMIHERLYQSESLSSIDFGEYVASLSHMLHRSHRRDDRVSLQTSVVPVSVDLDVAIPCGMVLNELLANSLEHAFDLGQSGEIHVELAVDNDGSCTLTVRDDGKGAQEPRETHGSFGLRLVDTFVKQLSGRLETHSGSEGTRTTLMFSTEVIS